MELRTNRLLLGAAVALFVGVAAASSLRTAGWTWAIFREDRTTYENFTFLEQEHSPGDAIPLPVDRFDFYRDRLERGDRYHILVPQLEFGTADFPTTVKTFARFYLLPGVLVEDPRDATVVLAWDRHPHELGLAYEVPLEQAGVQAIYVARVIRER